MKKMTIFSVVILLFLGCMNSNPVKPTQNASLYFPLQIGNTWRYTINGLETNTVYEQRITTSFSFNNRVYYIRMQSWSYGRVYLDTIRTDDQGNILKLSGGKEYTWLNFTADSGEIYITPELELELSLPVMAETDKTIHTTMGVFKNCIALHFEIGIADGGFILYFAPYIGPIMEKHITFYGSFTYSLISASVNGKSINNINK